MIQTMYQKPGATKTPKKMYAVGRVIGMPIDRTEPSSEWRRPFLIKVPAVMTTIPEIPPAVIVKGRVALKTSDAPLTYEVLDIQPVPVRRVKR